MDYFYDMSYQSPTQDEIDFYFQSKLYFSRKQRERAIIMMKDEVNFYAADWYEGTAEGDA